MRSFITTTICVFVVDNNAEGKRAKKEIDVG